MQNVQSLVGEQMFMMKHEVFSWPSVVGDNLLKAEKKL
jgi:hypothetical protein